MTEEAAKQSPKSEGLETFRRDGHEAQEQDVTELQLWLVSEKIGSRHYKCVGRRLEFNEVELQTFQSNNRKEMTVAVFKMLVKWSNQCGEEHFKVLSRVLNREGLNSAVKKILRKKHIMDPIVSENPTKLDPRQLEDIASRVPVDGRFHLGLRLGLTVVQMDEIHYDCHDQMKEIKVQFLSQWQRNLKRSVDQRLTLAKIMDETGIKKLANIIRQNHLRLSEDEKSIEYALGQDLLDGQAPAKRTDVEIEVKTRAELQAEAELRVKTAIADKTDLTIHQKLQNVIRKLGMFELRKLRKDSIHLVVSVYSRDGLECFKDFVQSGELGKLLTPLLLSTETLSSHPDATFDVQLRDDTYQKAIRHFDDIAVFEEHMTKWSTDDVGRWAKDVVGLPDEAVQKLHEVDGTLLTLYQKHDMMTDLGLRPVHCTKLLIARDQKASTESRTVVKYQGNMAEWDQKSVGKWLLQGGFHADIITAFADVDGALLARYSMKDLLEDTGIDPLSCRKLLYLKNSYLLLEKGRGISDEEGTSSESSQLDSCDEVDLSSLPDGESFADSRECDESFNSSGRSSRLNDSTLAKNEASASHSRPYLTDQKLIERLERLEFADFFDSRYFPFLVVNRSNEELCDADFIEQFNFVAGGNWSGVFDCDADSNTSGLCAFVSGTKPLKIRDLKTFEHVSDVKQLRSDLDFPDIPVWLFANGRKDLPEVMENKLPDKDWMRERCRSTSNAVRFFLDPSVTPMGRERVLFLLMSDEDTFVMSEIFRECMICNSDLNYAVLARDDMVYNGWKKHVISHKLTEPDQIDERSIVGSEWRRINRALTTELGEIETSLPEIPPLSESPCKLDKRTQNGWTDITVVASNQCMNTAMTEDNPRFDDFVKEHEQLFYRGNEVDWWNFHFSGKTCNNGLGFNHVLKRSPHSRLYREITRFRNQHERGSRETGSIEVITIFHEAGSGGTTLGKQMLWDFREEFRCISIDRVSSASVDQIIDCFNYNWKEGEKRVPMLVLADNFDPVVLRQILRDLQYSLKDLSGLATVVFLHCQRIIMSSKQQQMKENEPCVYLQHTLSQNEKLWFDAKLQELEKMKEHNISYSPDKLLGFMAMKEECKKEYFENVVREILLSVNKSTSKALDLLKFIAVLQKYLPNFALPVPACDTFMKESQRSGRCHTSWEKKMPECLQILLTGKTIKTTGGRIHCLRTVSQGVSKELVNQLCLLLSESQIDMVSKLVHSSITNARTYYWEHIKKSIRSLFVHREDKPTGRGKTSKFSPFLEEALQESRDKVYKLLNEVTQDMDDPYVAQQLSRLFLYDKRYDESLEAIDQALRQRNDNSYFWDTKGRIFQGKMSLYQRGTNNKTEHLNPSEINELCDILEQAIEAFKKCQEVMRTESFERQNQAGFEGEARVIFDFLTIIKAGVAAFSDGHKGKQELFKYLTSEYIPRRVSIPSNYHKFLKGLIAVVENDINRLADEVVQCFTVDTPQESVIIASLEKYKKRFFQAPPETIQDSQNERNRFQTAQILKGEQYRDIIKQCTDKGQIESLQRVITMLSSNNPRNLSDARVLTFLSFALFSLQGCKLPEQIEHWVRELKKLEDVRGGFYGLFFHMILLWTKSDPDVTIMSSVTKPLTDRWTSKYSVKERNKEHSKKIFLQPRRMYPSVEFYLGIKENLRVIQHKSNTGNTSYLRLQGVLKDKHNLLYRSKDRQQTFLIKLEKPCRSSPSQETVQFTLGFSFAGLRALDVRYTDSQAPVAPPAARVRLPAYLQKCEEMGDEESGYESALSIDE